jgi:hypothetical protein
MLTLILGIHRSGTSALSGVLTQLGLNSGLGLIEPNPFNERGYFELESLNRLMDDTLQSLDRSWDDFRPIPGDVMSIPEMKSIRIELSGLLAREYDLSQPCLMKDPRVSRLLPLCLPVMDEQGLAPLCLFSLRRPEAVAASLLRRDGMHADHAALLYCAYLLEAEFLTRQRPRAFVQYQRLLTDWRGTLSEAEQALGQALVQWDKVGQADTDAVDDFLSPELNHFTDANLPIATSRAMILANRLYLLLSNSIDAAALAQLDELRAEWLNYVTGLEPWATDAMALAKFKKSLPTLLLNPDAAILRAASSNAFSILHWAEPGSPFDGPKTIRLPWHFGDKNSHRFTFPARVKTVSALRWDITECPAALRIEALWLEDATGHKLWQWAQQDALFGYLSSDLSVLGLNEKGPLALVSSGLDPYGELRMPQDVLAQIAGGCSLCAEWSAQFPTVVLPQVLRQLRDTAQSQSAAQAELQRLETLITEHEQRLSAQSADIGQLKSERDRIREEISRAEGQLQLLRELWTDTKPIQDL